jgi:hypothetical protein
MFMFFSSLYAAPYHTLFFDDADVSFLMRGLRRYVTRLRFSDAIAVMPNVEALGAERHACTRCRWRSSVLFT